jgi:hypothetical protein
MINARVIIQIHAIFAFGLVISGCTSADRGNPKDAGREPVIDPDYSGVTIPPNTAPLNFTVKEEGNSFLVNVTSPNGRKHNLVSSGRVFMHPLMRILIH